MNINFKKLHPDAKIPTFAKPGDAGADLTCVSMDEDTDKIVYKTGIAIEIPTGYLGFLMPRSSNVKKDLILGNSVGLLDSGFRGELSFVYKKVGHDVGLCNSLASSKYRPGDRIGQIVVLPYPEVRYFEVGQLSNTERGTGGFGSSGA